MTILCLLVLYHGQGGGACWKPGDNPGDEEASPRSTSWVAACTARPCSSSSNPVGCVHKQRPGVTSHGCAGDRGASCGEAVVMQVGREAAPAVGAELCRTWKRGVKRRCQSQILTVMLVGPHPALTMSWATF